MKKVIAALTIFFSLHGLFGTFYFFFFSYDSLNRFTVNALFAIRPYSFDVFYAMIQINHTATNSSSVSLDLLNLYFFLSFLIGGIIYIKSKYRETRLLAFNFSLIILIAIARIIYFAFSCLNPFRKVELVSIIFLLLTIGYMILSSFFIRKFLNNEELNTYTKTRNDKEESYLEFAPKSKRFLNMIIDNMLIITIAYSLVKGSIHNDVIVAVLRGLESIFGKQFGAIIYYSILRFIYYFTFEYVLKATPAKLLTHCKVTDEEGNDPTYMSILYRTFCRLIPFESISFLINKNLHDSYSNTYVINQKKKPNRDKYYFIFMGIGFVFILVIYFYTVLKHF